MVDDRRMRQLLAVLLVVVPVRLLVVVFVFVVFVVVVLPYRWTEGQKMGPNGAPTPGNSGAVAGVEQGVQWSVAAEQPSRRCWVDPRQRDGRTFQAPVSERRARR